MAKTDYHIFVENGKVGLKDATDRVVLFAVYDGIVFTDTDTPICVCKDGKWGIVKGDGSGEVLCEFKFDYIENIFPYSLYLAKWGGEKDHFGVIDLKGDIICPNILASYSDWKVNAIIAIKADGKWGVIDGNTHLCVLPEYDDIESSPDDFIVFRKDGVEGYITDQGEFVTKQQYEEDENGNRTWEGYYDRFGGQANCNDGYFSCEREYDSAGRLISERYLDRYNKLTNNAEGVAGWNGYYDAEGNLILTNKYNQEREALPTNNP